MEFDDQGNLHQIYNLNKSIVVSFVNQGFYWYQGTSRTNITKSVLFCFICIVGFAGNNSQSEFQASGAYIFRPLTPNALPVSTTRSM